MDKQNYNCFIYICIGPSLTSSGFSFDSRTRRLVWNLLCFLRVRPGFISFDLNRLGKTFLSHTEVNWTQSWRQLSESQPYDFDDSDVTFHSVGWMKLASLSILTDFINAFKCVSREATIAFNLLSSSLEVVLRSNSCDWRFSSSTPSIIFLSGDCYHVQRIVC